MASLKYKDILVDALIREIELRKYEWAHEHFETIYFGGGTPTVLSIDELKLIFECIFKNYSINQKAEITIEANPDDLSGEYLMNLKNNTPVNRLSIGIQSFRASDLIFMNRRHTSIQSINCISDAKSAGFDIITIDLIYGIPGLSNEDWNSNLDTFLNLNIPHLSAYHLSIEPKTVFGVMQKRSKLKAVNEDLSIEQYQLLTNKMNASGYSHYEISNFARENYFSRHNSAYWNGTKYIGIGPSAHSFDGNKRRWNIANNSVYCESLLQKNAKYFEEEELSLTDKFNDYLITSLRTIWGADIQFVETNFGEKYKTHCLKILQKNTPSDNFTFHNSKICLTEKGWFIADYLISEFIWE